MKISDPILMIPSKDLPDNMLCCGIYRGDEKIMLYNPTLRERNEYERRKKREHSRPDTPDA